MGLKIGIFLGVESNYVETFYHFKSCLNVVLNWGSASKEQLLANCFFAERFSKILDTIIQNYFSWFRYRKRQWFINV